MAYGGENYAQMAYNLLKSIKHYAPDLPVAVLHDGCINSGDLKAFDYFYEFTPKAVGRNKVELDQLTPFDHTLYLDADSIAVNNLEPLLDACIDSGRPLLTQVHGQGGLDDPISYAIWTKNATAWAWFDIPYENKFQATQTSIVYFNKSANYLFKAMRDKFDFPRKYLTHNWGNSIPDELIYSGVCAHYGVDVSIGDRPIFFGNTPAQRHTLKDIRSKYFLMSFCGSARQLKPKYLSFAGLLMDRIEGKYYDPTKVFTKKFAG